MTSDWVIQTVAPTRRIQQKHSCIGGKRKIRTSTVSIYTSTRKKTMFVLSIDGIIGKGALAVLANLSLLMVSEKYEPI